MKFTGVKLIKDLYNVKSKEIKIPSEVLDKIFKSLEADFFVEINVQKTSIVKYLNKKNNNLIHFLKPEDAEVFREIRDNLKEFINEVKSLKIDKKKIDELSDREALIFNFIKTSQNNDNISIKKFKSDAEVLSKDLKDFFISNKKSLDIVKGFNEPTNVILIHLNSLSYQSFFKIHGNFLMFNKAKILLIGDDISANINFFKKYEFKPLYKNLTKNTIWSKNV